MKQLIQKVKLISILLLVISFVGCENDDVELPKVISGFTHTINAETGTVTFINTSVNSRNYFWSFGDGTSSTEINPIKTYSVGEYNVTLKATNVAGASDTSEDIVVISDVGAPIITLLGDTTINIALGGTFTDPGATATDDVGGDLTASIVIAGDVVDVNTAGTYIITYNVSDAAGNAATQRTRTVIVAADTVAPVITLLGNATMNIMVGDTFTDPGATATDDVDGDITSNIVVAGDTVDVNTAGTYIITYNVSDAAGNAAAEVTRTVIVASDGGGEFDDGLLTNGDFENGTEAWSGNALDVQTEGGNSFNFANVTTAGQPFDVNLSQGVAITQGKTYTLSFEASSDGNRTMLAGIGLYQDPWTNQTQSVNLTTTTQNFELTLSSETFGDPNSRVIFDMGADTGVVVIDKVSLFCLDCDGGGGGGGGDYNLSLPIDFENDGYGASWTWNVFENGSNPALEFVTNPSASGINQSSTVAKITALQAGQPWVGTETAHGQMGITWDLSASNAIIKIMVYKTVISDVGIKLVNPTGGAQEEIKVANTVINQWEELTFDFSSRIGNGLDGSTNIDQIVVFPDFNLAGRTSDNVVYFDNITFNAN